MKRLLLVLLAYPIINFAQAQTFDPLSLFPHHNGDVWQYWEEPMGDSSKNFMTQDSVGSDGRHYVQTTLFPRLVIDTATKRIYQYQFGGTPYLLFQLDADSGDSWTVYQDTMARISASVSSVFLGYVFTSERVQIKQFDYYVRRLSGRDSLLTDTYYLASGIGMIQQDQDAMTVRVIKGALIDGVVYGYFTGVNQNVEVELPSAMHLEQNYPNPFNPSTMIEYDLARRGFVHLAVFDVLGRRVATLVDGVKEPGRHQVQFDASHLSSGIYFYELRAGGYHAYKKMALLR